MLPDDLQVTGLVVVAVPPLHHTVVVSLLVPELPVVPEKSSGLQACGKLINLRNIKNIVWLWLGARQSAQLVTVPSVGRCSYISPRPPYSFSRTIASYPGIKPLPPVQIRNQVTTDGIFSATHHFEDKTSICVMFYCYLIMIMFS